MLTKPVSWGVIVVNWLTIGSAEAESNLSTLVSQRTILNKPGSRSDPLGHLDSGLVARNKPSELKESQEVAMRTRQASATTTEVPMFYEAASLKDEGGLLRSDGVRESWNLETGHVGGHLNRGQDCEEASGVEDLGFPRLKKLERTWGESSKSWAEGSKVWITVNDRIVKE